ncbi:hypothetical protein PInf_017996 [Phytophthora infestans]|nr:hypothetical protein PInf_017996 [Phytophthora infestans]
MDHLLNDAPPEDTNDEVAVKNEAPAVVSPSSSAASLGLHMLSVSAAAPALSAHPGAPPRLPPISLLTAAAAALQPMQCQPLYTQTPPQPQLRPVMTPPLPVPTSSVAISETALPAGDMLCRYRNKKCGYPRAIKRNGERHNLCERHRAKANQNQRKLESKRRTQKRMKQRAHSLGADRIVKAKKAAASAETEIRFTLYGGSVA